MKIKVALKSIGKRKQSVEPVSYEIEGCPSTVRDLIFAVTEAGVTACNNNADTSELLPHLTLTKEEIEDQALAGRIAFGVNYGGKSRSAESTGKCRYSSQRANLLHLLSYQPVNPRQRELLIQYMGNAEESTSSKAMEMVKRLELQEQDYRLMEDMLRFKRS